MSQTLTSPHPAPEGSPAAPSGYVHEGGSLPEVIRIAAPAVLSMLSVTLMWVSDTFFVGQLGTAEQGAVGFAGVVAWTFASFVNGILTAVQIFVAQHIGARSEHGAGEMTWQGIAVAMIAAVPLFGVGLASEPILAALRIDPALLPHAVEYFRIRLMGSGAVLVAFACEGYLRGIGDTRTPMLVTFLANGVNILLDYALIFGHFGLPRMGVAGAAWGTVAATILQAVILFVIFERRALRLGHLARAVVRPMPRLIAKLLRVGSPVGVQWVLDMGSWSAFTVLVARIGEVQAAAHQVATAIIHVSFMPGYGISVAATTLVGQYLGAGDRAAAWRGAMNSLRLGVGFMGLMGLGFLVGRGALVRFFNADPAVVEVGGKLMAIAAVFQMLDAVNLILSGVLRGAGDTRFPMIVTIVMSWVIFLPLAWLMSVHWERGVVGGWTAIIVWTAGLAAVLGWRVARRRWLDMLLVERRAPAVALGEE